MGKPFYKRKGDLADSIHDYGFAATIEVSNHLKRKGHKLEQAIQAKEYLESIVEGDPLILAGVAFNGTVDDAPYTDDVDFIIEIRKYNRGIIDSVAENMCQSRYISKKAPKNGSRFRMSERDFLKKMLSCRGDGLDTSAFFDISRAEDCAKRLGMSREDYSAYVGNICGVGAEMYMKEYFERMIPDGFVVFRHQFVYGVGKNKGRLESDADNILICQQNDFYRTLHLMDKGGDFKVWTL
jgi:hypothetical protein